MGAELPLQASRRHVMETSLDQFPLFPFLIKVFLPKVSLINGQVSISWFSPSVLGKPFTKH